MPWHVLRLQILIFLSKLVEFTFCRAVTERQTRNLRAQLLLQAAAALQLRFESLDIRLQLTACHNIQPVLLQRIISERIK